jgi:hypothetical protein
MLKYLHFLSLFLMGLSALVLVLKLTAISTAIIIYLAGLALYLLKLYKKRAMKEPGI